MEIRNLETISIKNKRIQKVIGCQISNVEDVLSIEEPLEIRLKYYQDQEIVLQTISVTMRTPGNDFDLAVGFLFTEGIINSFEAIKNIYHLEKNCDLQKKNSVIVELHEAFLPKLMQAERNFYTTSSCGVCGKSSIEAIKTVSPFKNLEPPKINVSSKNLYLLSQKLRLAQSDFSNTGGIHASALFSLAGELLILQEDVGRHNALDKLIGSAFAKKNTSFKPTHFSTQRKNQFRISSKSSYGRNCNCCSHWCTVKFSGRTGCRMQHHSNWFFKRKPF